MRLTLKFQFDTCLSIEIDNFVGLFVCRLFAEDANVIAWYMNRAAKHRIWSIASAPTWRTYFVYLQWGSNTHLMMTPAVNLAVANPLLSCALGYSS